MGWRDWLYKKRTPTTVLLFPPELDPEPRDEENSIYVCRRASSGPLLPGNLVLVKSDSDPFDARHVRWGYVLEDLSTRSRKQARVKVTKYILKDRPYGPLGERA